MYLQNLHRQDYNEMQHNCYDFIIVIQLILDLIITLIMLFIIFTRFKPIFFFLISLIIFNLLIKFYLNFVLIIINCSFLILNFFYIIHHIII
jgi:hypothetical protein